MPDNSAADVVASYEAEPVISYTDWLKDNDANSFMHGDQSFWSKFFRFFDGSDVKNKANYQAYLDNLNLRNERKALQSAAAYDEFMSNTRYQRAFKDLEKAGVNPYMLVQSGGIEAASSSGIGKPSYRSESSLKSAQSDTNTRDVALILTALASLIRGSSSAKGIGESRKDIYYHFQ